MCCRIDYLPVHRLVVALRRNYFRRQVVGRAAQRPCDVRDLLGEPEVGDLEMAVAVEQQIFRLQVAVDDVVRVQVVQRERDLGGVELCDGVGEALGLAQQTKQLPALDKVHDHVQVLGVLEGAPQRDQERVLDLLQHAPLVVGVLDLLHLDHLRLLQHLDGVEARIVLGLDEVHAPEAAGAERALDGEVGQRVLALCGAGLVERLCLELHHAILGGRGVRAGRVGGVYQVLYAGDVVRGGGLGRRWTRILLRRLRVGGVHRVGFGSWRPGVVARFARVALGIRERLVRLRLMQVERARLARGRRRDGRGAVSDGRRRRIEVFRAVRVLRPLLLEEAQGRHWGRGREECGGRPGSRGRSQQQQQQQQGMRGAMKRGMRLTIECPAVNARGWVAIECVFAAWARRAVGWLVRGGWRRFDNDVRLAGKQQQVASEERLKEPCFSSAVACLLLSMDWTTTLYIRY
jgi:hypothetical protein